jgi:outer membrane protein OmpA-like peptidoglycan-associated protein
MPSPWGGQHLHQRTHITTMPRFTHLCFLTLARGGLRWLLCAAAVAALHGCASGPKWDTTRDPTREPPRAARTPEAAPTPPAATALPAPNPANAGTNAGTNAAPQAATKRTGPLSGERQWLQSWFVGTPVVITELSDGAVSIEVPREFCFDAGDSKVKPALAAVLDKVAQSLRRTPTARLQQVASPADTPHSHSTAADTSAAHLALQRANKVRGHLLAKGAPAARMGNASTTLVAAVQLRMDVVAP